MKVQGVVRPPGDKSISHRVLMLAALARGTSELSGLLTGEDVKSTARVLRQLGADISPIRAAGPVSVHASRITHPASRLNCGNSGTTARLMLGILAGIHLIAGLWTPVVGVLVAVTELRNTFSHPEHLWTHILLGTVGAALALLGPGAWSVDARLFGWKRIDIRDRQQS